MSGFLSRWCLHSMWTTFTCLLILGEGSAETSCGGDTTVLRADGIRRILSFPLNRSEDYPPNCRRYWKITSSNDAWVKLYILELDIQEPRSDGNCAHDALHIQNYYSDLIMYLATLCGTLSSKNRNIDGSSTSIGLNFLSDGSIQGKGFSLYYFTERENACEIGPTVLQAYGTRQLLSFPSNGSDYPANCRREWRITASSGWLQLDLKRLDIQEEAYCGFDSLKIYDEEAYGHRYPLRILCGKVSTQAHIINSFSRSILLSFVSDYIIQGKGFALYYTNKRGDGCEAGYTQLQANGTRQLFSFPSNGSDYPANCQHQWEITASTTTGWVELYLVRLDLEENQNCGFDALDIYGDNRNSRHQLAKLCGKLSSQTRTINSTSYSILLSFHSDYSVQGKGFAFYYVNGEELSCRVGTIYLRAGDRNILSFPSDRSENYPPNCQRQWRITASSGWVELYLLELDMEEQEHCNYDALTIYDGENSDNRRLLAKLCGPLSSQNRTITSTSSSVLLSFQSDASIQGKGFSLIYEKQEQVVISLTATYSGRYLTYPTTNSNYSNNADVRWRIATPGVNLKLEIYFRTLDIEHHPSCGFDSLTIYDGYDSAAPVLKKLCGRQLETIARTFRSSSSFLFLHFTSDGSVTGKGFKLGYFSY